MADVQTDCKQIKQKFKKMKIADDLSDTELSVASDEFANFSAPSVIRSSSDNDKMQISCFPYSSNAVSICEGKLNDVTNKKFNMGIPSKNAARKEADTIIERSNPKKSLFCVE